MRVLPACVSVYHIHAQCWQRLEESIRCPKTGITVVSSPAGAGKSNPGSQEDPKDGEAVTAPHVGCLKSSPCPLSRREYIDSSCSWRNFQSQTPTFPLCCVPPYLGHHQLRIGDRGLGVLSTCLQVGKQVAPEPSLQLHLSHTHNTFKFKKKLCVCIRTRFSCLSVYVPSACNVSWGQKRVSDPLGLESEIIGSHEQRVLSLLCSPSF